MDQSIASESGHWYRRDGTPCHTVIGKNGKERPATLRDARELSLVPSVTSIMQIYPKPMLTQWQIRQGILAALTLPRNDGESDKDYLTRVMIDSQEQGKKAAERGTAIHGAIERSIQGQIIEEEYKPFALITIHELMSYLGSESLNIMAEKSFAHPLGYGGKVDLHSRELNFVLDFKTRDFTDPDKVKAYDENKIQLSAYRRGLDMPEGTRLLNVYISTTKPGLVRIIEHDPEEEKHYWNVFLDLLTLWKRIKKY